MAKTGTVAEFEAATPGIPQPTKLPDEKEASATGEVATMVGQQIDGKDSFQEVIKGLKGGDLQKAAGTMQDAMMKAVGPVIAGLQKQLADTQAELAKMQDRPMPPKGRVSGTVVDKSADATLAKGGLDLEAEAARLEKLSPNDRATELIKHSFGRPMRIG
jgi:hypothetical protein